MSIFCRCKNEFVVENKEISDAVEALEWLRKALDKRNTEDVYNAYEKSYQNMQELVRKLCGVQNSNIMVCKSIYDGFVLILEMDYLDDGCSPYELVEWPTADELEAEGIDSFVGLELEVQNLVEAFDSEIAKETVSEWYELGMDEFDSENLLVEGE